MDLFRSDWFSTDSHRVRFKTFFLIGAETDFRFARYKMELNPIRNYYQKKDTIYFISTADKNVILHIGSSILIFHLVTIYIYIIQNFKNLKLFQLSKYKKKRRSLDRKNFLIYRIMRNQQKRRIENRKQPSKSRVLKFSRI